VTFFDSLPPSVIGSTRKKIIQNRATLAKEYYGMDTDCKLTEPKKANVPRQPNCIDCGVYAILFIERLFFGQTLLFERNEVI
jgi:Ulp1 family protease